MARQGGDSARRPFLTLMIITVILMVAAMVIPLTAGAVDLDGPELVRPFLPDTANAFETFGDAVDIDGDTMAIGAPCLPGAVNGAVHIFVRSGGAWAQQASLEAPSGGITGDEFGSAVALSGDILATVDGEGIGWIFERSGSSWSQGQAVFDGHKVVRPAGPYIATGYESVATDGTRIAFGSPQDSDATGGVWIYTRSGSGWTLEQAVTANPTTTEELFGASVAIDGDYLLAGAPQRGSANRPGSVYVFHRNAIWSQESVVTPADSASDDTFGSSVALGGTTAVVGAYDKDSDGAAYVFERSGTAWSEQAALSGGTYYYGYDVDIDGDTVVVGSPRSTPQIGSQAVGSNPGEVYVYTRSGSIWNLQELLYFTTEDDWHDWFGQGVGISGDTLVGGAPERNVDDGQYLYVGDGQAYVFDRTAGDWTLSDVKYGRTANDVLQAGDVDLFGFALAADTGTLVVGGPGWSGDVGAVWVYDRGSAYEAAQILTQPGDTEDTNFAHSVDISGDRIVVGAPSMDGGGRAYLYERSGGTWNLAHTFVASDAASGNEFGTSVAIDGDRVVVGDYWAGTVYVYTWNGSNWSEVKVEPTAPPYSQGFGWTVAIDGDVLAATLRGWYPEYDAYIFEFTGTSWVEKAHFEAEGELDKAQALSVSGDTVAVGSKFADVAGVVRGSVQVYRGPSTWVLEQRITIPTLGVSDQLGRSVDLLGDRLMVGAQNQAYVYERSGSAWAQTNHVHIDDTTWFGAPRATSDFSFGAAVAQDEFGIVIGAPRFDRVVAIPRSSGTTTTTTTTTTTIPGGGTCGGKVVTIEGDDQDNEILGTKGDDVIDAGEGNDTIRGLAGNDTICGGPGDDTLLGHVGDDTLYGGPGNDLIRGHGGSDTLYGEGGIDRLQAGAHDDVVYGGDGADKIWGGIGNDLLYGDLPGESGKDKIWAGPGADTVYGGDLTDWLFGDAGPDVLYGEANSDYLYGGIGDDIMWGSHGNDRMFGWAGDDVMYGEAGKDQLRGQQDNDTAHGGDGEPNRDWCSAESWTGCESLL